MSKPNGETVKNGIDANVERKWPRGSRLIIVWHMFNYLTYHPN